ncbi:MAG: leucine-rich repeat domain-containing protein [Muribaculaceae bacterium]|nr:leucine-rich repeat domain-containing protein [Muribaculaceae bacterium]
MKKTLLNSCMAIIAMSTFLTAKAEPFTVDGITYNLLTDGSGVEVTEGEYSGEIVIPATVKYGNITYKVTAIGKRAFQNNEDVISVKLPNTILEIGDYAFNASDIQSIDLGQSVEIIEEGAFSVMRNLKTISEIPASCVKMDGGIFTMNDALTAINVSPDNKVYKSVDGVVYTKSGTRLVAYPTGKGNEYTIAEGTDTIGANVFNTNQSLKRINFPSSLKVVDIAAFTYCTAMETNDLPEGLEKVYANAFSNCRKMASKVPSTITFLGNMAFNNCYKITEATINDRITNFGSQTFASANSMTKLTFMPNPVSITAIPDFAFQSCGSLSELIIPEGYTEIGSYAFSGSKNIKKIDLPSSMTSINTAAFNYVNPDTIIIRAAVPPTYLNQTYHLFGTDCFETVKVFVPEESISAYEEAWIWKFFKNYLPISNLTSGIADTEFSAEVVAKTYYNIQGIEVPAPESHDGKFYIIKTTYSDGSVKTAKTINR